MSENKKIETKNQKLNFGKTTTFIQIGISLIMCGVAVIALITTINSVEATKKSAKAAKDSAKAAKDSAMIAQQALEFSKSLEEENLYIYIQRDANFKTKISKVKNMPAIFLKWSFVLVNNGKVPVNIVKIKFTQVYDIKRIDMPRTKRTFIAVPRGGQGIIPFSGNVYLGYKAYKILSSLELVDKEVNIKEIMKNLKSSVATSDVTIELELNTATRKIFKKTFTW